VLILLFLTLLTVKHFVFDFLYQPPYQWQNKGTYGHLGGIVHSGQHALASFAIMLFFINPLPALGLALAELMIHYHVDWAKMNINRIKGWKANTHNEFWISLGVDQLAHSLTYILMAVAVLAILA